jgi:hypothetical protein
LEFVVKKIRRACKFAVAGLVKTKPVANPAPAIRRARIKMTVHCGAYIGNVEV